MPSDLLDSDMFILSIQSEYITLNSKTVSQLSYKRIGLTEDQEVLDYIAHFLTSVMPSFDRITTNLRDSNHISAVLAYDNYQIFINESLVSDITFSMHNFCSNIVLNPKRNKNNRILSEV